jgi:hypothetical protein
MLHVIVARQSHMTCYCSFLVGIVSHQYQCICCCATQLIPLLRPYIAVLAHYQVFDFSYGILAAIPFSPFPKHDKAAAVAASSTSNNSTTDTGTDIIAQHSSSTQQQLQQSAKRATAGGTTDAPSGTDAMPK